MNLLVSTMFKTFLVASSVSVSVAEYLRPRWGARTCRGGQVNFRAPRSAQQRAGRTDSRPRGHHGARRGITRQALGQWHAVFGCRHCRRGKPSPPTARPSVQMPGPGNSPWKRRCTRSLLASLHELDELRGEFVEVNADALGVLERVELVLADSHGQHRQRGAFVRQLDAENGFTQGAVLGGGRNAA